MSKAEENVASPDAISIECSYQDQPSHFYDLNEHQESDTSTCSKAEKSKQNYSILCIPTRISQQVVDTQSDSSDGVMRKAAEKVVAFLLLSNGIKNLPEGGVNVVTRSVFQFLHKVAEMTKKQAEISLRSKSNLFDFTIAFISLAPCRFNRMLESNLPDLPCDIQDLKDTIYANLPLIRPYTSNLDINKSTQLVIGDKEWSDLGEQEYINGTGGRWERARRSWNFVKPIHDLSLSDVDVVDTVINRETVGLSSTETNPRCIEDNHILQHMPSLPPKYLLLGRDARDTSNFITDVGPDSQTRQGQKLEDNLHVQLLLPHLLQEVPVIESLEEITAPCTDADFTDVAAADKDNLFLCR